jgi:hypothetical protein
VPSPTLAAPVLLAAVLVLSGVAKLREPRATEDAFLSLRLPPVLARAGAPRALPWGELVLAALLLVAPGWSYAVVTVLAALLFVVYLVVVVRALGFDEPVTCGCFGKIGMGTISVLTAARNGLLVGIAAVAVADAVVGGTGPVWRLAEDGGAALGWLLAVLVAGALGVLVAYRPEDDAPGAVPSGVARVEGLEGEDPGEYERSPIPYATLRYDDGTETSLHALVQRRPALLVLLNLTCGGCLRVLERLPAFVEANPELDVHVVLGVGSDDRRSVLPDGLSVLVDPRWSLMQTFGVGPPAAVLLGADQLVAGGPSRGEADVVELLTQIEEELADVRAARP